MYKRISRWALVVGIAYCVQADVVISAMNKPLLGPVPASTTLKDDRPKLILTLVIDQFRADYLMRFRDQFLPALGKNQEVGGFAYLMANSAYFPYSEYEAFQNHTAAGHATILSGAYPYQTGISMNEWFSVEKKRLEAAVEDTNFPIVGVSAPTGKESGKDAGKENSKDNVKDATREAPKARGVSPNKMVATTLGDELKNAGYPSQVVTVALKDRAAVLLGGHRADLALWYDFTAHAWISSQYYLPTGVLPPWVAELNEKLKPELGSTIEWQTEEGESGYSAQDAMPLTNQKNAGLIGGKNFPHYAKVGTPGLLSTPRGLEITRQAAEKAFDAYHLGRGSYTDVLAVSFSSHDAVGHAFGPNSREMEEMTRHEDRQISLLLNHVRKTLPGGLKNVVIVLTGDHGSPPSPEWAQAHQINAGRIEDKEIARRIAARLDEKFGKFEKGEWVLESYLFNVYLNQKVIQDRHLSLAEVQKEAKGVLKDDPRIAYVVTSSEIAQNIFPPGIFEKQIQRGYYEGRSGDILIIPKPYFMPDGKTIVHITGYSYDRTVPLLLSGRHFRSKIFATRATSVDIAPTLSFLVGVVPPSLSEGRVLSEALDF